MQRDSRLLFLTCHGKLISLLAYCVALDSCAPVTQLTNGQLSPLLCPNKENPAKKTALRFVIGGVLR